MFPEMIYAAAVGGMALANVTADTPTASSPFDTFLQYGVLGLLVIGFVTGWIAPGYREKWLLEENRRLTALVEGKVFPLIEETGTTLARTAGAMEKATEAFNRGIEHQLREQQRALDRP